MERSWRQNCYICYFEQFQKWIGKTAEFQKDGSGMVICGQRPLRPSQPPLVKPRRWVPEPVKALLRHCCVSAWWANRETTCKRRLQMCAACLSSRWSSQSVDALASSSRDVCASRQASLPSSPLAINTAGFVSAPRIAAGLCWQSVSGRSCASSQLVCLRLDSRQLVGKTSLLCLAVLIRVQLHACRLSLLTSSVF